MAMTLETNEVIVPMLPVAVKPPRGSGLKQKTSTDLVVRLARAGRTIEKLEEQNDKAAIVLKALGELWLSPDANRRWREAEIALGHFNEALTVLRKSLAAK
jgi:hypothetical protein